MPDFPVRGRFFEDIIDGYFPLGESLRQMLARQGFGAALVVITHAPILHLPGDDGHGPVPMRLRDATAGLIRRLMVLAVDGPEGLVLRGAGDWVWPGDQPALQASTRLAEPAFLRGIGLTAGALPAPPFGMVERDAGATIRLTGSGCAWGIDPWPEGIVRLDQLPEGAVKTGQPASGGALLGFDPSDTAMRDASDLMARDFA